MKSKHLPLRFRCLVLLATFLLSSSTVANETLETAGVDGGLVVQLGIGNGELTAALRADDRYLVQGLDTDAANVDAVRKRLLSQGAYGPVSVALFDGRHLPYADNLVNLIVADDLGGVSMGEVMRVLAPRGVAMIGGKKTVKAWPDDLDEWTHFLHGPDNNAVGRDRVVGPPSSLQWLADPIHLRSHEHLNSVSAVVSAQGRVFYIIDEGPTSSVAAPPKWRLVARDAFNGLLLWKRDIGPWEGHFRLFRSGPPETTRRLIAVGARVYATLGYGKPVAAFDATSGKTVRSYQHTEGALEMLLDNGRLFVLVGDIDMTPPSDPGKRYYPPATARKKGIVVLDAASGTELWSRRDTDTSELMPTTLAVSDGRLFFQNTREVICLDASSGDEQWRAARPVYTKRLSWSTPTLVVSDGVVLSADGSTGGLRSPASKGDDQVTWQLSDTDIRQHPVGDLVAFSAETGRPLWAGRSLQGFCNAGDLFVIDGKVWCGADVSPRQTLLNVVVDLKTGEVLGNRPNNGMPVGGHTRCYRNKATERFLVLGDVGVEFVDVGDWSWNANPWVRGTCQYGVMPCNGLLYVPPDSCACRPEMRLHGFSAMAPARQATETALDAPRLMKGPAFAQAQDQKYPVEVSSSWPTYRNDIGRTGHTSMPVPTELKDVWQTKLGGQLTSLTVGAGKVFTACVNNHTVYALDAKSGKIAWSRTVGGLVDSPPTIHGATVLFGCRDGRVYCLSADDGRIAWQFRAAPRERLMVAMENVESTWPVHGSVLVRDGTVWCAAGRSPYLDGGIHVYALEAASGKVVAQQTVFARGPQTFNTAKPNKPGATTAPGMPDILSASDELVYMRWMALNDAAEIVACQPHLFSATGFLDDTWWHRTYWQYGTWMRGGFGGWPQAAIRVPAGRIMVEDSDRLFGFARTKYDSGNGGNANAGHIGVVKQDYQDMGRIAPRQNPLWLYAVAKPQPGENARRNMSEKIQWRTSVPMLVRAMLQADQTLFIAGPPAKANNQGLAELATNQPGLLWAVSTTDGKKLAEYQLPSTPVFDGMAAAENSLYFTTTGGTVQCLGGDE